MTHMLNLKPSSSYILPCPCTVNHHLSRIIKYHTTTATKLRLHFSKTSFSISELSAEFNSYVLSNQYDMHFVRGCRRWGINKHSHGPTIQGGVPDLSNTNILSLFVLFVSGHSVELWRFFF